MMLRREITIILALAAACGDNGGSDTAASATAPTTVSMTAGPSTLTTSDGASTSSSATSDSTDDTMTAPTAGTTSTGENAPVFLTLSTDPGAITEGETLTFTAILTDPDGVDDIVGGSLLNADGSTEFGAFVAAGQEGTYSFTLSWAQLHQADAIHFENIAETRVFNARFFDQAANSTTKTVSVSLQCPGGSACGGTCTDLASDAANCGQCDHSCSLACEGGQCGPAWSECILSDEGFTTCAQICQSFGEACAESQCGGRTIRSYGDVEWCMDEENAIAIDEPCDQIQDWATPAIKCCCTDTK